MRFFYDTTHAKPSNRGAIEYCAAFWAPQHYPLSLRIGDKVYNFSWLTMIATREVQCSVGVHT